MTTGDGLTGADVTPQPQHFGRRVGTAGKVGADSAQPERENLADLARQVERGGVEGHQTAALAEDIDARAMAADERERSEGAVLGTGAAAEKRGVAYLSMKDGDDESLQTAEAEVARASEELIAFMGDVELVEKVESLQVERSGMRDIILQFTTGFAEGAKQAHETDGNRAAWERDSRWGDWDPHRED